MKGNHVTYTGKSWRKKTYWEELEQEVPDSPTFIHLPARQYTSEYSHNNPSYLPYNNHYYGMDKIKGGKGYKKDGKPIGILGGKCPECKGNIIKLQMNTSRKGMECTSEKVCDTCGLIMDTAYIVLNKIEQEYHSLTFKTHEDWIEYAKEQEQKGQTGDILEGTCAATESFAHVTGERMNAAGDDGRNDGIADHDSGIWGKGSSMETDAYRRNHYHEDLARALKLNNWNAENWGRDSEGVLKHRHKQYEDYIGVCKSIMGMHNGQVEEVKYIIETEPNILNIQRYSYEDIISHICLVVMSTSYNNYRKWNAFIARYSIGNRYNKTLFNAVAAKLNI